MREIRPLTEPTADSITALAMRVQIRKLEQDIDGSNRTLVSQMGRLMNAKRAVDVVKRAIVRNSLYPASPQRWEAIREAGEWVMANEPDAFPYHRGAR